MPFASSFSISTLNTTGTMRGVILEGAVMNNQAGHMMSNLGDVDGDGQDDFAIINRGYNNNAGGFSIFTDGWSSVVGSNLFQAVPSAPNSTNGAYFISGGPAGEFIWDVEGIGDVNGDGIDDFMAASGLSARESNGGGVAYLFYGGTSRGQLSNGIYDIGQQADIIFSSAALGRGVGKDFAGIGDINGDGIDDFAISSNGQFNNNNGQVSVVYGGATLSTITDVVNLTSAQGFVIDFNNTRNFNFGKKLDGVGDINGDGLNDFVIASNTVSHVIFGKQGGYSRGNVSTFDGFVIGATNSDVAIIGDINGDGFDDWAVGQPQAGFTGRQNAGNVAIVYGRDNVGTGLEVITSLDFTISGGANNRLGSAIEGLGDVNGDGIDDFGIAAEGGAGYAAIIYGSATGHSDIITTSLTSSQGFLIGGDSSGNGFGRNIENFGDVNGDGLNDVAIGYFGSDNLAAESGSVVIGYGQFSIGDTVFTGTDISQTVRAGSGNDMINSLGGDDILYGNNGNDTVNAGAGNDVIYDGNGNDVVNGGAGDDILFMDSDFDFSFTDTFDGGAGFDTISYSNWQSGSVTASLFTGRATTGDSFTNVERLVGSRFNDILVGNDGSNDVLEGGDGNDALRANGGNDIVRGQAGNDLIFAGFGADTVNGGSGTDTLAFTSASGGVIVRLDLGQGFLNMAQGDTYVDIENVVGSRFGDLLRGDSGANLLDGRDGNDTLVGGAGADRMVGGNGFDTASYIDSTTGVTASLFTGQGAGGDTFSSIERLVGSDFNDLLIGRDGADDTLEGGDGNDALRGNGGDDTMLGGDGADLFFSGFGADSHDGGAGFDTISYTQANAGVIVRLDIGRGFFNQAEGDTYTSVEGVVGTSFRDALTGTNVANTLDGRAGNDDLFGLGGSDTLLGGNGADKLDGGVGFDVLTGGAGADTFVFAQGYQADRITDFTDGTDMLDLTAFGFNSFSQVSALASQHGADTVINLGNGDAIRLSDFDLNDFDANDVMI